MISMFIWLASIIRIVLEYCYCRSISLPMQYSMWTKITTCEKKMSYPDESPRRILGNRSVFTRFYTIKNMKNPENPAIFWSPQFKFKLKVQCRAREQNFDQNVQKTFSATIFEAKHYCLKCKSILPSFFRFGE